MLGLGNKCLRTVSDSFIDFYKCSFIFFGFAGFPVICTKFQNLATHLSGDMLLLKKQLLDSRLASWVLVGLVWAAVLGVLGFLALFE